MKTVLIFGTFDGIHEGHRDMFRQARMHGERLCVVVARDVTVEKVKGREPFENENIRMKELEKESLVDEVVLGSLTDYREPIFTIAPDIICLGYDQSAFIEKLQEEEFRSIEIIRLTSYKPHIFKSSKRTKKKMRQDMQTCLVAIKEEERKRERKNIIEKLLSNQTIQQSKSLLVYSALPHEVDLSEAIALWRGEGKILLFPNVQEGKIVPVVWEEGMGMIKENGIPCLVGGVEYRGKNIDVALVPSVAIDKDGWRLGRGGGYYDRFLKTTTVSYTIAPILSKQWVNRVPREVHDVRIDHVICGE